MATDKDGSLRLRSPSYLKTVRGKPCLKCGKPEGSAHHLNGAQERGWNLKVGDQYTAPLCHVCHMSLHRFGDEQSWWDIHGIDPIAWAKKNYELWKEQGNEN
jgi:hypothetical protein